MLGLVFPFMTSKVMLDTTCGSFNREKVKCPRSCSYKVFIERCERGNLKVTQIWLVESSWARNPQVVLDRDFPTWFLPRAFRMASWRFTRAGFTKV